MPALVAAWFTLSSSSPERTRISSLGSSYQKLTGGPGLVWLGDVPTPGAKAWPLLEPHADFEDSSQGMSVC